MTMNSLEFIKKEIRKTQRSISFVSNNLELLNENKITPDFLLARLESLNNRLIYLQQIKAELEAWEVAKNKCVDIHDIINCSNLEVYNTLLYKEYQLTEKEYQIIKKALEVNNE